MNSHKLLFLDFDGVLHSVEASKQELFCKAPLLRNFLSANPCEIVISSSWRLHFSLDELKERLQPPFTNLIVGQTGPREIGRCSRFTEIKNYISKNSPQAIWRALDDSIKDFPIDCPELIHCDPYEGITEKEIILLSNWISSRDL
jgi:hypothetical protein